MDYQHATSALAARARQINILRFSLAGVLLCNLVLGLLLWHQSDRRDVILIPSTLHQRAEITQSTVSASYLEAMALMLVHDRLNLTPENVTGSNRHLLAFVNARYYAAFKAQLSNEARAIKKDHVSSAFYVNGLRSNPRTLIVRIRGQLTRWVGERRIGTEIKRYQLAFSRAGEALVLTSFQEINTPKGT